MFYYHRIKSSILTDTESDKLLSLFDSQNKFKNLEPFEYKLIIHHLNMEFVSQYLKICHNQANLLCFIQSTNGNVFGGYTKCGWNDSDSYDIIDNEAFIFSIRSNRDYPAAIFNVINDSSALWKGGGCYCVFGGDCAFYINHDGTTGDLNGARSANYETYPYDYCCERIKKL